jgi:hypothetical protein
MKDSQEGGGQEGGAKEGGTKESRFRPRYQHLQEDAEEEQMMRQYKTFIYTVNDILS